MEVVVRYSKFFEDLRKILKSISTSHRLEKITTSKNFDANNASCEKSKNKGHS